MVEAGYLARVQPQDLAPLIEAMGIELWAWQQARRLTGQPPWRAGVDASEVFERARAFREMSSDLATWERAIAALEKETALARMAGARPPDALAVPSEILAAIESRRLATAERAVRRRARTGQGQSAPTPLPDDAVHPPFLGSRPP